MAAPKLIQILATLDKTEWTKLKKVILGHIGESSDCYKVFNYMMDNKANLAHIQDMTPIILKHFRKMGSKTFLNHLSTLYQYTESWMVHEQLNIETHTHLLLLHRNLNKRGLYHQANLVADKITNQFQSGNALVELQTMAQIKHQEHYSYNPIKYEKGVSSVADMLNAQLKNIYHQFSIYQLDLDSWGKIQNYDFAIDQEKLILICKTIYQATFPDFFLKLFELIKKDDIEMLIDLTDRLLKGEWPHKSFEEVISTIYLIRKTSDLRQRGFDIDAKHLLSKLYEYAMTHGVYTEHGKLAPVTFRNIVSNLGSFQSFDFTKDFIDKWHLEVVSPFPDTTRDVCHAINCFKNKRYDEIMVHTRMKKFVDHQEKSIALLLHLIAVFMNRKEDYDMYELSIHNFVSYIQRNKKEFSFKVYKSILNLIDIMKKVDKKVKNIDLKSYDYIFFRDWCEDLVLKEK